MSWKYSGSFLGCSMSTACAVMLASPVVWANDDVVEEVVVWATQPDVRDASYSSPTSTLNPDDFTSINTATTEDLVKFEPSLVVRRRFIGDSNGTLGIRGSNMFQTTRSMVFADGVPLHYLLQSRWNGAPRWSMVSASEIAQVDVIYGPFSAEYSGNAMGGVVLIETAIPQQEEFHFDAGYFRQQFSDYGYDGSVDGYKSFVSYGNKVRDLSYYLSYNYLNNDSQPQSFYYGSKPADSLTDADFTNVSGAIVGDDNKGRTQRFYGDSGVVNTETQNYKLKLGYDFGGWEALLNLAYEDRSSDTDRQNSYLKDDQGSTVWSGNLVQDGTQFAVSKSRLGERFLARESFSKGLRLKGEVAEGWTLEANVNRFDVLKDETRKSKANPNDPAYTAAGEVSRYHDTGWETAEVKLKGDDIAAGVGINDLGLVTGLRYEHYRLNYDVYNSDNYRVGDRASFKSRSGGETVLTSAFAQLHWDVDMVWDVSLGGRYEHWKSQDGYYSADDANTPAFDLVSAPGNDFSRFSPKLSVGYQPTDEWITRYSLAKAYRFPIVEELYSQFKAYDSKSVANPELRPEAGLHHNLMIERQLEHGFVRVNLFQETINDVIESQTDTNAQGVSVRTFVPIDELETRGVELIVQQQDLMEQLDLRFNLTWLDSEIVRNEPKPEYEGQQFPRMPTWRGNLLATWHATDQWDLGGSVQYASNSHGQLDNSDTASNVYGAQDSFTRLGLKTSYQLTSQWRVSAGIDNLNNDIAYVAHPWPGRTWYLNAAYDL